MQVSHGGGIFTTRTLKRTSPESKKLQTLQRICKSSGLRPGSAHTEFIPRGCDKNSTSRNLSSRRRRLHLRCSRNRDRTQPLARMARVEVLSGAQAETYTLPKLHADYAGIL